MGVYSGIAAEQLRESQFAENFHFTDLLEFAVNTEVANQRMFNAMIELDFHEAVEKMNGTYLTEANDEESDSKKESIITKLLEKIVTALEKFGEIITAVATKIAKTFKDLADVNKNITKIFGDLTAERLKKINAESVKDLEFTKYVGPENYEFYKIDSIKEEVSRFQTKIYATKNEDLISETDKCVGTLSNFEKSLNDQENNKLFETVKFADYIADTTYIADVKKNLANGYKKIVSVYTEEIKSTLNKNKENIKIVKKDGKEAKKEGNQRTITILQSRYSVYQTANGIYSKFLKASIDAARAVVKNDRAAYCKLGMLVRKAEGAEKSSKKQDQEVQHNSALIECYHIDLLNEQCVESIFE